MYNYLNKEEYALQCSGRGEDKRLLIFCRMSNPERLAGTSASKEPLLDHIF